MKEDLLKRQEELRQEFNKVKLQGQEFAESLRQTEVYLNQLSGAYNEIEKQLKELNKIDSEAKKD